MNRLISIGEVRLGLRLIAKQPIMSATIILALATGICLVMIGFTFRDVSSTARSLIRPAIVLRVSSPSIAMAIASTPTSSATMRSAIVPGASSTSALPSSARSRSHTVPAR